jgi:hypothetical protein
MKQNRGAQNSKFINRPEDNYESTSQNRRGVNEKAELTWNLMKKKMQKFKKSKL